MSTPSPIVNAEIVVSVSPDFAYETTSLLNTPSAGGDPTFPVTGVSADGTTFSPVTAAADGITDGPYLDTDVASNGDISIDVDSNVTNQELINDINSNTSGTDLEQTLYYEVSNGSTTVVNSADMTLNDINNTQYYGSVPQGTTTLVPDLSVSVPESSNLMPSNPELTVSFDLQASSNSALGSLELTGGEGTISNNDSSNLVISGTESQINADLSELQFTSNGPGSNNLFADIVQPGVQENDDAYFGTITTACYLRGTRILTPTGDVAIEHLSIGDEVLTASGARRPVRWLGFRHLNCAKHPDPAAVWPVLVRAGAFAAGTPRRDLWLSRGHSVFVDGALIQIENLINGATIVQVPRDEAEYWHVELDTHDIVMAEGLPAESYLDTGNRTAFVNGGTFVEAYPDFKPKHWRDTCVPLVLDGPEVVSAKANLLARAKALGYATTNDSDLHIMADGKRHEPLALSDQRVAFVLPAGLSSIELRCRTFIPAHTNPASNDQRSLGLCVGRLQLDGNDVALNDASAFARGWHALESNLQGRRWRWSHESTAIPAGTQLIVIDLYGESRCWVMPQSASLAAVG